MEDIDGILEIENRCFSAPLSKSMFASMMENDSYSYYAAFYNEKVAAYAGVLFSTYEGDIINIAVMPEFRRIGVAGKLLLCIIEHAKRNNISKLFLEVRVSNTPAVNLYRSFGFEKIGIRKNYYTFPREDALCMSLNL